MTASGFSLRKGPESPVTLEFSNTMRLIAGTGLRTPEGKPRRLEAGSSLLIRLRSRTRLLIRYISDWRRTILGTGGRIADLSGLVVASADRLLRERLQVGLLSEVGPLQPLSLFVWHGDRSWLFV